MKSKPLVSIIILTYNSELFIQETIKSVVDQDYPNMEIIIGDDFSQDDTINLISKTINTSNYDIKLLVSSENKGISENLNSCLKVCTGKYIFLLGGDDLFLPKKISTQVEFMEAHENCFISYHDVSVFNSSTGKELYQFNKDKHGFHTGKSDILVRQGTFNCGCATAIRNNNIPLCNTEIRYASDWLWYIDILESSNGTINYIDGIFSKYRRHSKNVTSINPILLQLEETILTLDICSQKYSTLSNSIKVAKAERLFTFSIKFLLRKKIKLGIKNMIDSFFVDIRSPLFLLSRQLFKKV